MEEGGEIIGAQEEEQKELPNKLRNLEEQLVNPSLTKEEIAELGNKVLPQLVGRLFPDEVQAQGTKAVCEELTTQQVEEIQKRRPTSVYILVRGGTNRFAIRVPRRETKPGRVPFISVVNPQDRQEADKANETLKQLYRQAYPEIESDAK